MQERLRIFLRLAIFWLVFMMIARIIFLLYNHDLTASLTTKEVFLSMTNGIRMDASISGYFLAASGLLLTVSSFTARPWTMSALSFLTVVLVIFASAIITVDMELYRHWGFRMNTTPLMYIGQRPWEVLRRQFILKSASHSLSSQHYLFGFSKNG
jgi:hypothetical protein